MLLLLRAGLALATSAKRGIAMRQGTGKPVDRPGRRILPRPRWLAAAFAATSLSFSGCTTLSEYVHNGFKVGPNYCRPPAPVAEHWIDANDVRIRSEPAEDCHWWTLFNDPVLADLVQSAYLQNITLREAGFRILQARATLGIAVGEFFPQSQTMNGDYIRRGVSENVANRVATPQRWFSQWDYGFNLAWEMDFWGKFRRAIEAAEDTLDASVENYDDVLVTLVSDVAANYVQYRVIEQKLIYIRENITLQTEILKIATAKFKGGQVSKIDPNQAQANLSNTQRQVPELEISLREANDRLCILLGIPLENLNARLGHGPIPTAPPSVAVGIPADLLRRRPDVRKAEREAAAQCAQIGIAESDWYPAISLNSTWGWSAQYLKDLFAYGSFRGSVGPSFQWELLNYFRILNNVRLQDAKFQALVAAYQQTALKANGEVEDGLIRYSKAHDEARFAKESATAELEAVREAFTQYTNGLVDYNRVAVIQEQLVNRQIELAQSQGNIALGLVQVYRALGGGWQIRCDNNAETTVAAVPGPGPVTPAQPAAPAKPPLLMPDTKK